MALIGRELTEEIHKLVKIEILMNEYKGSVPTPRFSKYQDDMEMCKRNITDALLAMDARKGVYASDPSQSYQPQPYCDWNKQST